MDEIDFEFIGLDGFTIYRHCFVLYLNARFVLRKPKEECAKLVPKVEELFFWLVESGKKLLRQKAVNQIIQKPDPNGNTCFALATQCSVRIAEFILAQDIKINSITTAMTIPWFEYSELTEQMMINNINPKVITFAGKSQFERWPDSFKNSRCKELAEKFPRSIHFATENSRCKKNCSPNCRSKLEAFFFQNGPLVDISEQNKLGTGGFGIVYGGKWHEEDVAMKCILISEIGWKSGVRDTVADFEKNISEYRSQLVAKGSGVIIPYAMIRQQNQEFKDGKWIPLNFNVFIYPRYDCNLYELHQNHYRRFNENILQDILEKCLIRI